jgi:SAM-dependent methyltransferase
MRQLEEVPGSFDAVLSLWQSFGYFDEGTNREVVKQISRKLKPQGRFILDIYHREYFEKHQGTRQLKRLDREIKVTNVMEGKRLRARLGYGNGNKEDLFEWHLYTPEEIRQLAGEFGLRCLVMCTEYDEERGVTLEKPRMNFVFERE